MTVTDMQAYAALKQETVDAYADLLTQARSAFTQTDNAGWKLAKLTFDAVTELMDSGLNKEDSLKKWAEDVERDGFSLTSARRYFTAWDKFGDPEKRLTREMPDGRELSFAEHYAAVKGGKGVQQRIQRGQSMRSSARTPEMLSEEAAAKHSAAIVSANVEIDDEETDTQDLARRIDAATAANEYLAAWLVVHDEMTSEQQEEFVVFKQAMEKLLLRIGERL